MADVEGFSVLPDKFSKGPLGLGDPNDKTLRKVETEVLIPKIIRDITKQEKCAPEVGLFNNCVKQWPALMIYKCRKENEVMKKCHEYWYFNEEFRNFCTDLYLKQRSEYRRTGIGKKQRELMASNNMENVS